MNGRRWRVGAGLLALVLVLWAWAPASDTPAPQTSPTVQSTGLTAAGDKTARRPPPRALAVRTGAGQTPPPPSDAERERSMLRSDEGPVVRCALEWQDLEGEPLVPRYRSFYLSEHALGDGRLPRQVGASATGLTLPAATAAHLRAQATDGQLVHELHMKERLVFSFTEQGCAVALQSNEVFEVHCSWPSPEDVSEEFDDAHPLSRVRHPHTLGIGEQGLSVATPEPEGFVDVPVLPSTVWRVHWKMGLCSGMERVE
jgi:hypothetical protein